jgi:hypothetical protein
MHRDEERGKMRKKDNFEKLKEMVSQFTVNR